MRRHKGTKAGRWTARRVLARLTKFSLISWCILFAFCPPSQALDTLVRENYDKAGRSFIKIDSVFGLGMRNGHLPFRITIRNNTGKDRVWTVRFNEKGGYRGIAYDAAYEFEVEDGSEITSEVMVPIAPRFLNRSSYRGISVTATAPGLTLVDRTDNKPSKSINWPTIGLSSKLAQRSLLKLDAARNKKGKTSSSYAGNKKFGYEYEATTLPSDWRGYTCLDVLMIDDSAWEKLNTSQRQSIIEWLRLGGRCHIYTSDDSLNLQKLGLDQVIATGSKNRAASKVSFGEIQIYQWDGSELHNSIIGRYQSLPSRNQRIEKDYEKAWQLLKDFGTKSFHPMLIFVLLVIFAITVAPVNLFYFAKEGKRHKLFITTPIISIAACLIIIAIIFLKDGLGGSGRRLGLADLQSHPDEMRLYLTQEQISRTGVMLGTGFPQKEIMEITPVELPDSPWNPLSRSSRKLGNLRFSGGNYSGDFFRSRTEQGYAIRNVQSTRSRIELKSPGSDTSPPQLFSSLGFSVKEFLYFDHEGRLWQSPNGTRVDPGNIIPLESAESTHLIEWVRDISEPFSKTQRSDIRTLAREKGRFIAIAQDPKKLLVSTAVSVRWKDDLVIVTGTIQPIEKNQTEKTGDTNAQ